MLCYINPCLILIAPTRNRFSSGWQSLQMRKGGIFPVNRTHDNGNHACLACLVLLERLLYFSLITVVGGEKVWTDEQQDKERGAQVRVQFLLPVTSLDLALVPGGDNF